MIDLHYPGPVAPGSFLYGACLVIATVLGVKLVTPTEKIPADVAVARAELGAEIKILQKKLSDQTVTYSEYARTKEDNAHMRRALDKNAYEQQLVDVQHRNKVKSLQDEVEIYKLRLARCQARKEG